MGLRPTHGHESAFLRFIDSKRVTRDFRRSVIPGELCGARSRRFHVRRTSMLWALALLPERFYMFNVDVVIVVSKPNSRAGNVWRERFYQYPAPSCLWLFG